MEYWAQFDRFLKVYIHEFVRDDDPRAHHDHPWLFFFSMILRGSYEEHKFLHGGILRKTIFKEGDWRFVFGRGTHRIELHEGKPITLFMMGAKWREWGFHCTEKGWVHWKEFTDADDEGSVGKGCGEG